MKCQYCEKPATFHVTELTGDAGPQILHLCEEHAREFLKSGGGQSGETAAIAGAMAKTLNLGEAKQELAEIDGRECPVCGITFFEFRNTGRLGCPNDYEFFETDLHSLLVNIHESVDHVGKTPQRAAQLAQSKQNLIEWRREMQEAIEKEDYERAGQIRDKLRDVESALQSAEDADPPDSTEDSSANAGEEKE